MAIRLAEYVSTINNKKPLTSIVFQLVLLILIILTIISKQVTVHGQSLNESLTTTNSNNNDETLINNSNNNIEITTAKPQTIVSSSVSSTTVNSLDSVDLLQQQLTTPQLESGYYNVSVSPLDQQLDDINAQKPTLIDVKPIIRSEQQQSTPSNNLINNTNNQSSLGQQLVSRSPTMPINNFTSSNSSLPTHQNNSLIVTNQSMIMICDPDRYTFDHQQVAKFFLTTMILLAFCCLLIVILLVLVTYIYRKLSKGRNVKVLTRGGDTTDGNIEIDTIKDGRFYPIHDNPSFDEDEFVGSRTDFRFFDVSSSPYNGNRHFNHHHPNQGNKSLTTDTFGCRH